MKYQPCFLFKAKMSVLCCVSCSSATGGSSGFYLQLIPPAMMLHCSTGQIWTKTDGRWNLSVVWLNLGPDNEERGVCRLFHVTKQPIREKRNTNVACGCKPAGRSKHWLMLTRLKKPIWHFWPNSDCDPVISFVWKSHSFFSVPFLNSGMVSQSELYLWQEKG